MTFQQLLMIRMFAQKGTLPEILEKAVDDIIPHETFPSLAEKLNMNRETNKDDKKE